MSMTMKKVTLFCAQAREEPNHYDAFVLRVNTVERKLFGRRKSGKSIIQILLERNKICLHVIYEK